jgi:hypothetical protein
MNNQVLKTLDVSFMRPHQREAFDLSMKIAKSGAKSDAHTAAYCLGLFAAGAPILMYSNAYNAFDRLAALLQEVFDRDLGTWSSIIRILARRRQDHGYSAFPGYVFIDGPKQMEPTLATLRTRAITFFPREFSTPEERAKIALARCFFDALASPSPTDALE